VGRWEGGERERRGRIQRGEGEKREHEDDPASEHSENTAALLQLAAIRLAVLLCDFSRYCSRVMSQSNNAPACEQGL
jgi:hypothetical protein